MTTKRLNIFREKLTERKLEETVVEGILEDICNILKFSTERNTYDDYKKEYYQRNKEILNKKRTESRRKKNNVKTVDI